MDYPLVGEVRNINEHELLISATVTSLYAHFCPQTWIIGLVENIFYRIFLYLMVKFNKNHVFCKFSQSNQSIESYFLPMACLQVLRVPHGLPARAWALHVMIIPNDFQIFADGLTANQHWSWDIYLYTVPYNNVFSGKQISQS